VASIDKFSRLAALKPARPRATVDFKQPEEEVRSESELDCALAAMLGATVSRTRFGSHLSVRNWHSTPEFCEPSAGVVELLAKTATARGKAWKPVAEMHDPAKWLFLDTETTGLAGGTGTYAFLIGVAWWDAGGLQVEQLLMRDFSEEHSVLAELAERIAERPVLVTFNGKTFDWPLLESRYVMTRSMRVPRLSAHLDLLHPARAVWKLRLGSVRLVELERHVLDVPQLGWHRDNDVPSALIPQFYFDYLRGGTPAPLAGVVRHNRMDLRGLAALFGKLNSLLHGAARHDGPGATHALDMFGLSRYLKRRGEPERAESTCVAARSMGLPLPFDAQAQRELALMAKQSRQHKKAAELWESLLNEEPYEAIGCEELAIHHERREKNFALALDFARRGLRAARAMSAAPFGTGSPGALRLQNRLQERVARLEKRLQKARGPLGLREGQARSVAAG
jgi:uncharacterized protein YprB with RNaseH-like and TPR domain